MSITSYVYTCTCTAMCITNQAYFAAGESSLLHQKRLLSHLVLYYLCWKWKRKRMRAVNHMVTMEKRGGDNGITRQSRKRISLREDFGWNVLGNTHIELHAHYNENMQFLITYICIFLKENYPYYAFNVIRLLWSLQINALLKPYIFSYFLCM